MFQNVNLKPVYNSLEDDLVEVFYNPILNESQLYLRASAYFSGKALARYGKGLEKFEANNGRYLLLINQEIEENDFLEIKKGLEIKKDIQEKLVESLIEELTTTEKKQISNLAYYVSKGIIEIKMAFTASGIFHDKFGFFEDSDGNVIYFRGSNNETAAAIDQNYEAFDLTCSWSASSFEKQKIDINYETFGRLWNNSFDDLIVLDIDDVIKNEIIKFSKGKVIVEEYQMLENIFILDLSDESKMFGINHLKSPNLFSNSSFYTFEIQRYIDKSVENNVYFKNSLGYLDYKKIIDKIEKLGERQEFRLIVSSRLLSYIKEMDIHIDTRSQLGINIKNQSYQIDDYFKKYKSVVDSLLSRKLRDKQMWDSFFMYAMKKSCNFSVPGSGKTSSVLGVFAYLRQTEGVKRIVMIGPKSAFDTWKTEYFECFRDEKLNVLDWQMLAGRPLDNRIRELTMNTGGCSLILLNYESIPSIAKEAKNIITNKTLVVFDEIHKIKKINGFHASASMQIASNAKFIIALTGTPIPNSYLDIFNVFNILFRDEYKYFFGFTVQNLQNPSENQRRLINEKIFPFFCRTTKTELDVPPANEDKILDVYSNETENKIFTILRSKYRRNKFAMLIRILQLESDAKMLLEKIDLNEYRNILDDDEDIEVSDIDFVDYSNSMRKMLESTDKSTKMVKTLEVVKELCDQGKSVIIWCIFKRSIDNLYNNITDMGIDADFVYGDVNNESRLEKINRFKEGKLQVLITNPHTLAESISLHKSCHDAVYFEYSFNLVHLLQSKDRIHRLGLADNQYTQYHYLVNNFNLKSKSESIDKRIYDRLILKEEVMIEAIENNVLEDVHTSKEDLDYIFNI